MVNYVFVAFGLGSLVFRLRFLLGTLVLPLQGWCLWELVWCLWVFWTGQAILYVPPLLWLMFPLLHLLLVLLGRFPGEVGWWKQFLSWLSSSLLWQWFLHVHGFLCLKLKECWLKNCNEFFFKRGDVLVRWLSMNFGEQFFPKFFTCFL